MNGSATRVLTRPASANPNTLHVVKSPLPAISEKGLAAMLPTACPTIVPTSTIPKVRQNAPRTSRQERFMARTGPRSSSASAGVVSTGEGHPDPQHQRTHGSDAEQDAAEQALTGQHQQQAGHQRQRHRDEADQPDQQGRGDQSQQLRADEFQASPTDVR